MKEKQRQFILDTLLPYVNGDEPFGYNEKTNNCVYLSDDGASCAFGKHLEHPELFNPTAPAGALLLQHGEEVLKPEARGMLTADQWDILQLVHDRLARPSSHPHVLEAIGDLETSVGLGFRNLYELRMAVREFLSL